MMLGRHTERNAAIIADRKLGLTYGQLAQKYGLRSNVIAKILCLAGATGAATKPKIERNAALTADRAAGMTYQQLMEKYRISGRMVGRILGRAPWIDRGEVRGPAGLRSGLAGEPVGGRTVIWRPQPGPQTELLRCPCFETLYGGARGGGKTDGMLGEFAQHAQIYGRHAIGRFFRRERIQLMEAMDRAKALYIPIGAQWREANKEFVFPNGARLVFSYLENDADAEGYQGHSYTRVYLEELGTFPSEKPIAKLRATLRSAQGVPCRMRATANPGGPGHSWVHKRYIAHAPQGYVRTIEHGLDRVFIPAKLQDNQLLLNSDPGYIDRLRQSGSVALVRAWLDGDWDAVEGAFFENWAPSRHVVRPSSIPRWWVRFTGFDWGSARPFCNLWFAVSDGEVKEFPKGALIIYREWYGASGPNQGIKLNSEKIAEGIRAREADGEKISYRVADPACFKADDGPSIAEKMAMAGVMMEPADNARIAGWEQIRLRLDGEEGLPMLYVFSTCADLIRTLPSLQHDDRKPEDLDSTSEDHCFHADTLVRTDKGLYSLRELVGTVGRVLCSDGEWHDYRVPRMTRRQAPLLALTFSNGETIRCTPDHRFLTTEGWKEARQLLKASILSLSPTRSRSFKGYAITGVAATFSAMATVCMSQFGNTITALGRRVITFIIRAETLPTTGWSIWSALQPGSIGQTGMARNMDVADGYTSAMRWRRHENGMRRKLEGLGIASTIWSALNGFMPRLTPSAIDAGLISGRSQVVGSVRMPAGLHGGELPASMTLPGSAPSAAGSFGRTGTHGSAHALRTAGPWPALVPGPVCLSLSDAGAAEVYCLTVPDTGDFALANGMIVANCADALRYGSMSRPYWRARPVKKRTVKDAYRWDAEVRQAGTGWAQ